MTLRKLTGDRSVVVFVVFVTLEKKVQAKKVQAAVEVAHTLRGHRVVRRAGGCRAAAGWLCIGDRRVDIAINERPDRLSAQDSAARLYRRPGIDRRIRRGTPRLRANRPDACGHEKGPHCDRGRSLL